MTPRTPTRGAKKLASFLLAVAATSSSCSKAPAPEEQRILVLDGIEIRFDDLAPYVEFLDSFLPEGGRKTKVMLALTDYVLPLRIAQRAFGTEREQLREQAQALVSVSGNVEELDRQSAQIEHKRRSDVARMKVQLPVAMFLFDPLNRGAVSQPIEVPQGWFVVGCFDYHERPLALDDYVDALQVGFVTHTSKDWNDWYEAEQQRIGDKATFVHPDYRDSMPGWIRPPKTP